MWQKTYTQYPAQFVRVAWTRRDLAAVGLIVGGDVTSTGVAAWSSGDSDEGRAWCSLAGAVTLTPVPLAVVDGAGRFEQVEVDACAWRWEARLPPELVLDCPGSE